MGVYKERFRYNIIQGLFTNQTELNQADLLKLFPLNDELNQAVYDIIVYKDIKYRRHNRVKSWAPSMELHEDLQDKMDELVLERNSLCEDRRRVEAWFRSFCMACSGIQVMFDNTPECLKEFSPNIDEYYILSHGSFDAELVDPMETKAIINIIARRKLNNLLLG